RPRDSGARLGAGVAGRCRAGRRSDRAAAVAAPGARDLPPGQAPRPFSRVGERLMGPSRACGYALRAVVILVRQGASGYVPSHQLARAAGIGRKYLFKLTVLLGRAGLVQSWDGPTGGYRLARPSRDISLLEIVEAVDRPVRGDVL